MHSAQSVAGHLLPHHPFFPDSWISLAHYFKTSLSTVAKSLGHCQYFPQAGFRSCQKIFNCHRTVQQSILRLLHSSTYPGEYPDAFLPVIQPLILSSTQSRHCSWAALFFWQIASWRIQFSPCHFWLCLLHCPSPTNNYRHNLHHNSLSISSVKWAIQQSLQHQFSVVQLTAGFSSLKSLGGGLQDPLKGGSGEIELNNVSCICYLFPDGTRATPGGHEDDGSISVSCGGVNIWVPP